MRLPSSPPHTTSTTSLQLCHVKHSTRDSTTPETDFNVSQICSISLENGVSSIDNTMQLLMVRKRVIKVIKVDRKNQNLRFVLYKILIF